MGKAKEWIDKYYGFRTRMNVNPVTDTVLTTPTQIFQNNPDRIMWLAMNLSSNTGYQGFDRQVSANKGVIMAANGGYSGMNIEGDGEGVTLEVFGINLVANGIWYMVEVEGY